ncbi:MAG: YjjG family noncanonical pyrimidine nucleotidase [Muribaculaceae bacterium]|nr:YjjG family noncanonical pyrimidine nucleotidase [Muribaculaceae bacterium]
MKKSCNVNSEIPVVWLDLDDTLWDFKANSRVALAGLYADHGLDRWFSSQDEWIERYERHNHALWDRYNHALITKDELMKSRFRLPLEEVGSPMAAELGARFDGEYLDRLAECTRLVDGAIDLLEWIKDNGMMTGVLSNGFTEVQHRKIRNSGLAPLIDYTVLSDDIGVNKPDVRLYRHAEQVAGTTAARCIMVGDNPDTDISGAVDAGWKAIYLNRGNAATPTAGVPTITTLADAKQLIADFQMSPQ